MGVHDGRKPLDIGNGHVAVSFDWATGGWISIGAPHPTEGFVELNAAPPFDEGARGDPTSTRRYRASLAGGDEPFLSILVDGVPPELVPDPADPIAPSWQGDGLRVSSQATTTGARQRWRISRSSANVELRLRGRLDRPALAEITELDPPQPTGAVTTFATDGDVAVVRAEQLDATVSVRVRGAAVTWKMDDSGLLGRVAWHAASPDGVRELVFDLALRAGPGSGDVLAPSPAGLDGLATRAVAYVRGCTAVSTGPDERAFIADHRILPLSWTRDAYWQALALLATDGPNDLALVADHLRWLWLRCERPDGRWVRSHHADGRRKDRAFQADQQLYPLLELADYWRRAGGLPPGVEWEASIGLAWAATVEEVDPRSALMATTENAADDPAAAPFIGASQILLWYAASRMGELAERGVIDLDPAAFTDVGKRTRAAFDDAFAEHGEPWPYAVDGHGARVRYHDANDLPVALAPLWGFCAPTDPGWRATMAFAFSAANPGFVTGRRSGLGSVHTPGPWTLGDLQAWIWAREMGDEAGAQAARDRLTAVAYDDGMLPEAYATDGEERVRAWFAWPGAAYVALTTLEREGRIATIHA